MPHAIADILALFITDKDAKTHTKPFLQLDEKGIVGDKHYNKNRNRSVLITSVKAYRMAEERAIVMSYGSLGENIVIDYDLHLLKPGDQLKVGEVVLEIVQNCTLCNHLSKIDKSLPKLLCNDRGIFAKVVKGGILRQKDTVHLLKRSI